MENYIFNIAPDDIVKAICNTLIHSLWQGLLLSIVVGLTILSTKKSSSDIRYKLMTGYLFLFTVVILFTFFKQLSFTGAIENESFTKITGLIQKDILTNQQVVIDNNNNLFTRSYNYLTSNSSVVVLIWFLIVWIKYVRFTGGLFHIYQLKRKRLLSAGNKWENKVAELSRTLGIKSKVTLLQSGITKIPITIGHLKPLILIPIGLLNNLTEAEVEAILLHELSHIKRKDYLVNMLQSILEIIFFFNPSIIWLSTLIKAERENCCDDIVINKTSDKATYIQALLSCQEYNTNKLAMAFANNKTSLVGRVRRIATNNNQTLNIMEKGFLTFSVITALVISLTVSTSDAQSIKTTIADTAKNINQFAVEAKRIIIESEKMREESLIMDAESKKLAIESEKLKKESEAMNNKISSLEKKGLSNTYFIAGDSVGAAAMRIKSAEMEIKSKEAIEKSLKAQELSKIAEENSAKAEQQSKIAEENHLKTKALADVMQKSILTDLTQEGIIKNSSNLSYSLSITELIINGKKQSTELHKKLAQKYLDNKAWTLNVKYGPTPSTEPVQFGWNQN